MSSKSGIEWTEATWNPVVGCTKVSEGCRNCYAMRTSARMAAIADAKAGTQDPLVNDGPSERMQAYREVVKRRDDGIPLPQWNNEVRCIESALSEPLRWRTPRMIFVNSQSDLFHESVPFDFIDRVFAVMALCPRHIFQILTKRPERMAEYLTSGESRLLTWYKNSLTKLAAGERGPNRLDEAIAKEGFLAPMSGDIVHHIEARSLKAWPLPNVWLGTSVEDQDAADERIPHLLRCPAAVRFLSCEPLLGAVDVGSCTHLSSQPARGDNGRCAWCGEDYEDAGATIANGSLAEGEWVCSERCYDLHERHGCPLELPKIDWVIVGGESGPGARPMHPGWARSIRDQCADAGVPFFFKQWGAWRPGYENNREHTHWDDGECAALVGKKAAGRLLDGVEHNGMPR